MKLPVFFFDIDGTLLDYMHGMDHISDNTVKALDELRKNHPAFIASGRTKCFIDEEILKYPFDGFVTCNGAYVEYHDECVYKKPMEKDDLKKAMEVADQLQAVLYLEDRDHMYVYNAHYDIHLWFKDKWQMKEETIVTEFDPEQIEVYIGMILCQNEESAERVYDLLCQNFDVSRHVKQNSFDLTIRNENKAKGINEVMKHFNSDLSDAWAFGDANNDYEMISQVGHGIAMGNAVEEIKEIAYDITDDATKDGIVTSLKKYQWI